MVVAYCSDYTNCLTLTLLVCSAAAAPPRAARRKSCNAKRSQGVKRSWARAIPTR